MLSDKTVKTLVVFLITTILFTTTSLSKHPRMQWMFILSCNGVERTRHEQSWFSR